MNDAGPRVGLLLPSREVEMGTVLRLGDLLELAVVAEEAGLDSVWVGDSPLARPRADPFTLLGAVAARTTTIGLGTAALLPALRPALATAHAAATLDQLAPGRVTLGVGAGFPLDATRDEFAAFGAPFAGRARRLDQIVGLWRALWSDDAAPVAVAAKALGVDATAATLRSLPRPASPGGPEIWLAAGASPAVTARVARHYDGWLPYVPSPQTYADGAAAIRAACSSPPVLGLYLTLTLADDDTPAATTRARDAHDAYLQGYYGVGADVIATLQACHVGDPASAVDFLGRYLAAGARHLVIRLAATDHHHQLALLADHVLPAVRTALATATPPLTGTSS